jgi:hypothetical protein
MAGSLFSLPTQNAIGAAIGAGDGNALISRGSSKIMDITFVYD